MGLPGALTRFILGTARACGEGIGGGRWVGERNWGDGVGELRWLLPW